MIYGLVGCCFGLFALLLSYAAQKMIGNFESTGDQIIKMKSYFSALQNVWLIYMPLMIIIGFVYAFSGWLIQKEKKEGILIGIFASVLNLLWFAGYAISLYTNVMPVFPHKIEPAVQIVVIAMAGIFICLYPLYFLITFKRIELKQELTGIRKRT